MKLLHCLNCADIISLREKDRTCECGASGGRYVNQRDAEYRGPARILGMLNQELRASLFAEHIPFEGPHYKWFVINEGDHVHKTDA